MTDADLRSSAEVDTASAGATSSTGDPEVTAHRSAPGRTVFTEAGNSDAWIASSLTIESTR